MTQSITIALNKLTAWSGNVRKTKPDENIGELAASIAAHGLLQSLVVRKAARGKYAVIAGRRRLLALQSLEKCGNLAADFAVPCILIGEDANASELSLAENVIRLPMHPADQFEAFRDLIEHGASIPDIAVRFSASEDLVEKRLRLGRLSPVILDAFRTDEIGLQEAMAFALADDHAAQERVFAELTGHGRNPRAIRQALTQGEVPATDKRVRFIGLEAYEAAGGTIRRDLFDDRNSGYLQDAALLDSLVSEKLKAIADAVKAEGWKFVDVFAEADYSTTSAYDYRHPERAPLSKNAEKQIEKLNRDYEALSREIDSGEAGDDADERVAEIEARIDALNETAEIWSPETLAACGAIVTLDYNGTADIRRGMVRPEDASAFKAAERKAAKEAAGIGSATALPSKLVADLTANKTAAIRAELAKELDIALAAVVHAFALKPFYRGAVELSCLEIACGSRPLAKLMIDGEQCRALADFQQTHEGLRAKLPTEAEALWSWCLTQDRDTLLEVLAYVAALTVDAVHLKDLPWAADDSHAQALATALNLDMTAWYAPTATNFFTRVNRKAILTALEEAKGAPQGPALDKMKKQELAERAERIVAGTGWLPALLRSDPEKAKSIPEAAE